MKDRFKNIAIFFLVILTVYQVTQLWFEDPSSYNFFSVSKQKSISPSSDREPQKFHSPYRILVNDGNNNYSVFYSDIMNILKEHNFDDIIYFINDLEFVSEKSFNLIDLLDDNRCIVYEYNFSVKTEDFSESISQKTPALLSKVQAFDSFAIYPNKTQYKPLRIIFSNSMENKQYEFKLNTNKDFSELYNWIDKNKNKTVSYDLLKDLKIFKDSLIIPYWQNDFEYGIVKVTNPYRNINGEEDIATVEPEINNFFDNPSAKNAKPYKDSYYAFSDTSRKVLYYYPGKSSFLEYNNYKTHKSKTDTLVDRFNIAIDFIKSDKNVINDMFLHSYKETNNETTFYFDYTIGNFPIFLSDDFASLTGLNNHIEITVQNNVVSHYKKIVLNYEVADYIDYANYSYNKVLDGLSPGNDVDSIIESINLGYKSDISGESYLYDDINLNWVIKTNENMVTHSAKESE